MDRSKVLIVVDIGHNVAGDNGAVSDFGLDENSCAKQIGEKLYEVLTKWGYKVMYAMTDEDKAAVEAIKAQEDAKPVEEQDKTKAMFDSLRRRCKTANDNFAQLFVSLHLNSNGIDIEESKKGRGTTIFVKTDNEQALGNMILNQICNQHYELGSAEFSDGVEMLGKPYKNNGVMSGENLYVLRNTFCPAILIENLFVDTLMDSELYKDKKPYINHEHTTLEEGVPYVNENVFSYNFFAFSIARGIEDYVCNNLLKQYEPMNVDSYETTDLNYVCYTERKKDTKLQAVLHKNGALENIYGGRLISLLTNEKSQFGNDMTVGFMGFNNLNTVQSSYVSIMKPSDVQEGHIKNIANLGKVKEFDDKKAIVFNVKGKCNVYRSDGSAYCTITDGCQVGIYLKQVNTKAPSYSKKIYETYDFAKGPIVCEPTKPNLIKVNFIVRNGNVENVYNEYNGDNYAWLETNLGLSLDLSDFVLELNV